MRVGSLGQEIYTLENKNNALQKEVTALKQMLEKLEKFLRESNLPYNKTHELIREIDDNLTLTAEDYAE
jgi:uncharacterized coiled-coil DUF342 family protein